MNVRQNLNIIITFDADPAYVTITVSEPTSKGLCVSTHCGATDFGFIGDAIAGIADGYEREVDLFCAAREHAPMFKPHDHPTNFVEPPTPEVSEHVDATSTNPPESLPPSESEPSTETQSEGQEQIDASEAEASSEGQTSDDAEGTPETAGGESV